MNPSHGLEEGNAVCYASRDGGKTWDFMGIPAPYEPGTNRMNLAAGLSNDGSLVTIVSGWGGKGFREYILPNVVSRSQDNGKTWSAPMVVISHGGTDSGYPANVQLDEGTIVTAYYSNANKYHQRYHMGCVRWKLLY